MSDKKTFDETIALLRPHMDDLTRRRALIESALFGCPVLSQIQWDGSEYDFTVRLVGTLLDFGEYSPGQPAIVILLKSIREHSGVDKHTFIDELIHAYQTPPARVTFVQPQVGQMIGGYRLIRTLGEGGNGVVWLVEKPLPESGAIQRAMKILRQDVIGDVQRVQRFREEIGIAAQLGEASRSLHILPVYDWDQDGTYVVMKYVPGETLRQRMDGKAHSLKDTLIYLEPLAKALDDAHTYTEPVIHRDVKPENVLLGERLYLADFGLAVSPKRGNDHLTRKGERPGTGRYMAPEQWREQELTIRTDLYALAIIAYEMLTGQLPFIADNDYDRSRLHCEVDLPPHPALPDDLLVVLRKGAAKEPGKRYGSASEFIHQLKNWQDGAETLYARAREYTEQLYYQIEKLLYARFVDLEGDESTLTMRLVSPAEPTFDLLPIYDISAPMTADYVEGYRDRAKVHVENVRERLLEIERGVLVAEPGAGKTWMLLRTAYEAIRRWRNDPHHAPIPVIVPLNRFNGQETFAQYVHDRFRALDHYAERLQRDNRLLLLCDALNEMPQRYVEEVVSVLKGYQRFIVSCRARDYTEQLKDLHPLEQIYLHDLDLPGIEALITKRLPGESGRNLWIEMGGGDALQRFWDKVHERGEGALFWQSSRGAPSYTTVDEDRAWLAIHSGARLIPLCRNPYMGHLLCQVYQEARGELPRNRAELFKRFVITLIQRETRTAQQTGRSFPSVAEIEIVLITLAGAMQKAKRTVVSEGEARAALEKASIAHGETLLKASVDANLLTGDGEGLKFAHQLLQEYFAAHVLLEAMEAGESAERFFGASWWEAGAWRETIVILGEFLGEGTQGPNRVLRWLAPVSPELSLEVLTRHGAGYTLADVEEETKAVLIESANAKRSEVHPIGRATAYRILGLYNADTRPGVGVTSDGLPDIAWVTIPAGEFHYGHKDEGDNPPQRLTLPTFQISQYPITYAQYETFMQDSEGFYNPRWWQGLLIPEGHNTKSGEQAYKFWNHPRERVSWYDAIVFCRWLTARLGYEVRLPTEVEWEKAARGTDGRIYPYGSVFDSTKANTDETGIGQTSAVGLFASHASPYGVDDMSGNVWEWCFTNYNSPIAPIDEKTIGSTALLVMRGGSWLFNRTNARAVFRDYDFPHLRNPDLGFRVVHA